MDWNKKIFLSRERHPGGAKYAGIILKDERILTWLDQAEMYELGLHHGCFISTEGNDTDFQTRCSLFIEAYALGCRFVSPAEFKEIEARRQEERTAKAFAEAERMIAED